MRSIWGKIRSLAADIHEQEGEIIFLSEIWEKSENKKHKHKIEEMLEMSNIAYISTPRHGAKRGGGAAIAISTRRFAVTKLNIFIPNPLEIVWALLRPVEHTGQIRKIILCSIYSPPNSKKNKTWSSVSNSSLSKTFALCQFRKLKKMSPKIIFGQKKILVWKKI